MKVLFLVVIVACGRTSPKATAPGTTQQRATLGPECPAAQPDAGSTCTPTGSGALICEYGGDIYGHCAMVADCAADIGTGPFPWHLYKTACPADDAAGCPQSFASGLACPVSSS